MCEKIPLMGSFKYFPQSMISKLERRASLNFNSFVITPTERLMCIHFPPLFGGASPTWTLSRAFFRSSQGRWGGIWKHTSDKFAVLRCSAAANYVFTNEQVFDRLFLFGGHRLKRLEKLHNVCPVTVPEDFLERLIFPSTESISCYWALITRLIKGFANPRRVKKMLPPCSAFFFYSLSSSTWDQRLPSH